MKKALIALAVVGAFAAPAQAADSVFGSLGDAVLKMRNTFDSTIPSQKVALEADGANFRLYFFTPPDNPAITCWVAAGTDKGAGSCYPKGGK